MSRARDTANTQDNVGGAVAPYVAGKNFVINGGFDFWQRGTSFVNPNGSYTADRIYNAVNLATISRQSSGAPNGSQYYLRTTATGASSYTDFYYFFETSQIAPLWGKTVTYSFKVRRNATTSGGNFVLNLKKSSTVDAGSAATFTTIANGSISISNIPTGTTSNDWATVSVTVAIPNDGTANSLLLVGGFDTPQSSGAILELAQVQLEIGSVATPFSRAGGSIGGELALCQRYYYRNYNYANNYTAMTNSGYVSATNALEVFTPLPVSMRTAPTSVDFANLRVWDYTSAYAVSAVSLGQCSQTMQQLTFSISGATIGRTGIVQANASYAAYIGYSAEL